MIIINKPESSLEVQCYRCKAIMKAHPMANMNSDYYTNCDMHKLKLKESLTTKEDKK